MPSMTVTISDATGSKEQQATVPTDAPAIRMVGHLDIVDVDAVEHSNLARCVLFRDGDEGRPKAVVAAGAVRVLTRR
jgi:molybdopterin/thiamine biosynthesis adenylyltransferase